MYYLHRLLGIVADGFLESGCEVPCQSFSGCIVAFIVYPLYCHWPVNLADERTEFMSPFCIIDYGFIPLFKGWHASIISKTSAHYGWMAVTSPHDDWSPGLLGVTKAERSLVTRATPVVYNCSDCW